MLLYLGSQPVWTHEADRHANIVRPLQTESRCYTTTNSDTSNQWRKRMVDGYAQQCVYPLPANAGSSFPPLVSATGEESCHRTMVGTARQVWTGCGRRLPIGTDTSSIRNGASRGSTSASRRLDVRPA